MRNEDDPPIQDVLTVLDDPDCRTILREAAHPMTARELTEACDISSSTIYRKLDQLSDTTLLTESYSIHPTRGRITRYQRNLSGLYLWITDEDQFDMKITRGKRTADEQLAAMWSEMSDEL